MGVSMIFAGHIRWVLLLCMLLIPVVCSAYACEPKSIENPNGTGSRVVERVTPIGDWRYFWCPEPNGGWRLQTHVVLAKYRSEPKSIAALLWAIATEQDRLSAINKALEGGSIKPQGPQEAYEFALLLHQACTDAISPPIIVRVVTPPAGWCGSAPVLAVSWVVAPNTASTTTPPTRPLWDLTGTKGVAGRAVVGSACDCAAPVIKGTQTLCRVPPGAGLAYCVKP